MARKHVSQKDFNRRVKHLAFACASVFEPSRTPSNRSIVTKKKKKNPAETVSTYLLVLSSDLVTYLADILKFLVFLSGRILVL